MKNQKGTTLIEVIIYIALFSILITGSLVTAIQLIDSSNKTSKAMTVQEEGNFFIKKITWALDGLDPLNPPIVSGLGCSQTLTLNKLGYFSNPIIFRLNSNKIELSEKNGTFVPITTLNVEPQCLQFKILPKVFNSPLGVSATTTINGIEFGITKYLRN